MQRRSARCRAGADKRALTSLLAEPSWCSTAYRHADAGAAPREPHCRGDRFREWPVDLKGLHDVLCLTHPEAVRGVQRAYLEAGADGIETNTFDPSAISLAEDEMGPHAGGKS